MNGIFTAVLWENGLGDFYWVEIIYAVVGSFAGLLFALASDKLFDTWQERRRLKTIRNSIKGELMGILADLEQIIEEDNHDLNYLNRMLEAECIVWDSVKNSDIFIELIHQHNDEYARLIAIYNGLAYLNRYEEKYDTMEISNSQRNRSAVIRNIRELRGDIVKNIKEYLENSDKY
ncbi:MAG: hypothetical protein IKD45_05220 [Clostridia bacterium]|nr:hypothetical protein [Clostridia bacterium]